ncbi:MAG: hypothetical protein LQ342_000007 [Letrouitia transgressa]|nr:MAG: hypothetical protein LQ342_000007 [Letrouitia transgressa]
MSETKVTPQFSLGAPKKTAIESQNQPTCTPIDTPAPEWKVNTDYTISSLVRYSGRIYQCRQAHHSLAGWEPPRVPALWATPTPCGVTKWQAQTSYQVGSKVTFDRQNYQCVQAHTSLETWEPPATPALWTKVQLIRSILLSKSKVELGETFKVAVRLYEPEGFDVAINGLPGATQLFQFYDFAGIHKIMVTVHRRGDFLETRAVDVQVEKPGDSAQASKFPFIAMKSPESNSALFEIANFGDVHKEGAIYTWDFGGAGTLTTTAPSVSRSFEEYLDVNEPYRVFDVRVTISYPSQASITSARSIVAWNVYHLEKKRGFIKPTVRYDYRAFRQDKKLVAKCNIKNLEPEVLHLTKKVVQFLMEAGDEGKAQEFDSSESINLNVSANSEVEFDCSIPSPIPRSSFGYAVHLGGETESGKAVRVSCYFEYRQDNNLHVIMDTKTIKALHDMRNHPPHRGKTVFTRDEVIRHIDSIENSKDTTRVAPLRGDMAVRATAIPDVRTFGGEDLIGKPCLPDEEPPEEGMACQLTTEWAWVTIPARIVNAFKGDAILSPAGNGLIGGLLRQVSPPQAYSHSGIMTKDYYEIRHSTASEARMEDHLAGSIFGAGGTDGIDPETLKYAWPGTITQTVQAAFNGENIREPGTTKEYRLGSFEYRSRLDQNLKLAPALVVKPDPFREAQIPSARATLHKVADAAKAVAGHYRFYAYTDASISSGQTSYNAPDRGASWWASKTIPTVCSSFIWAAAKAVQSPRIELEGAGRITKPEELEPADVAADAQVDGETIDGLYTYNAEERRTAAEWLYSYMYNLASDRVHKAISWLPASWAGDAPDDLGNQMVNAFASDWTGDVGDGNGHAKDSDRWRETGPGHAVSPNNILFWDPPTQVVNGVQHGLYGYAEKLVYRPETYEYRQISRWVRVQTKGTVKGTVSYRNSPVDGANVSAAAVNTITALDGTFTLDSVPAGTYEIKAGKLINGIYIEGKLPITVTAGSTLPVDIVLQDPPDFYREVVVRGSLRIKDDETFGDDIKTYAVYHDGIFLEPFATHAEQYHEQGHGGEIRVEVRMAFDWKFPGDLEGSINVKFFEGASEDTDDLEDNKTVTFQVARGATETVKVHVENSGFGGGDTGDLTLQIENKVRP